MSTTEIPAFRDPALPPEERARDLVARLTLPEKASQMLHRSPAIERLDIPDYCWWNEGLHGVSRAGLATVFPQAIGLAATFDTDLMRRVTTAISDEARAKYHVNADRGEHGMYRGLTYWSPNINIFRDPRWGRGQETYGECPHLTARMGVAYVRGMQGDDPRHLKLVATPKHYAVHSGPEVVRHEFDAHASKKDLWETYLPAFRACVVAGQAASIMGAYNRLDGVPCCANRSLLTEILREKWGFRGFVVSDCGAIADFHEHHHVTESPVQSAALAVNEGCDLNCGCVYEALLAAVEAGLVDESTIDTCVTRLFEARIRLGMFDPPENVPYAAIPYDVVDCAAHQALAVEASARSVILLKNTDGLLPLTPEIGTIAVIGPTADDRQCLLGNYHGLPARMVTPLEGIRARVAPQTRVLYAEGCDLLGIEDEYKPLATAGIAEACHVAEQADIVIACVGLSPKLEGEHADPALADAAGDRIGIELTGAQSRLVAALARTGKPVVLVLISGSALATPELDDQVGAIVQHYYSGQSGGTALAQVLFGDVNPAGRLPVTVYRSTADLPPIEDYDMARRTYRYFDGTPLYPFGFGLSFTRFEYDNLRVSAERVGAGTDLAVTVDVRNAGARDGDEVVQLYLSWPDAPWRVPTRQLADFRRVSIASNETAEVALCISAEQLKIVNDDGAAVHVPGRVQITVAGSQGDDVSRARGAAAPVTATITLT